MKVEFSADGAPVVVGEFVTRSGKIFQTGSYAQQAFSLDASEMQAACDNHRSAGLNVQHVPTIFDMGDMGQVTRIWNDGKELYGEVQLDRNLDAYFEKHHIPIRVSAEWNRQSKTLEKLALVHNPAITDAAIYAAFSRDPAVFGRNSVAAMHDSSVYSGAECGGKSLFADAATFMTPDELKTLQKVHDLCSGDGKHCDAMASRNAMYSASNAEPMARTRAGKGKSMTFKERMAALFAKAGVPKEDVAAAFSEEGDPATPGPANFADTAEFKAMTTAIGERDQAIADLNAKFAKQEKEAQLRSDLTAIGDLKRSGRMTAAEATQYEAMAREKPASFADNLPVLQARTPLAQFSGPARRIDPTPETPTAAFTDAVKAYADKHKVGFGEAAKAVGAQNPELASAHFAANSVPGGN